MLAYVYFACDLIAILVVLCYSACIDLPILSLIGDERADELDYDKMLINATLVKEVFPILSKEMDIFITFLMKIKI